MKMKVCIQFRGKNVLHAYFGAVSVKILICPGLKVPSKPRHNVLYYVIKLENDFCYKPRFRSCVLMSGAILFYVRREPL